MQRRTIQRVKAQLVDGILVPDVQTVRNMMKVLKDNARQDPELAKRWKTNPRRVLGEMGLPRSIQNQLLREEGRRVLRTQFDISMESGCWGCSGCCCTGCSFTG